MRSASETQYAELHCRTSYSFLAGASHPKEVVTRGADLKLAALAVTDLSGVYGIVRTWEAAKEISGAPRLIYGSELELDLEPGVAAGQLDPRDADNGLCDPDAVVLLARNRRGYAKLCRLISAGRLRVPKGEIALTTAEVHAASSPDLMALVGGPRSRILRRLREGRRRDAERELAAYADAFGDSLCVEVTRHRRPGDVERSHAVADLARQLRLPVVVTNDVQLHDRGRKPLHDILTCIRHGVALPDAGRLLLPNAERCLKGAAEMLALFADMPEAVARTVEVAGRCTFRLDDLRYFYPEEAVPPGMSADLFLAQLARAGLQERLGASRAAELSHQLHKELGIITQLQYAGYFLTMWEIVRFCEQRRILCQGRGSAANSLVCYALRVTSVSPDQIDMLFERFLSVERHEPPDIDLDIEHERREEVIQHVYEKYGRERAAMVAEVIRYRRKSAIRDVGKALGLTEQEVLRISRTLARGDGPGPAAARAAGLDPEGTTWQQLLALSAALCEFPRHLSIHVGGFVLAREPVSEVVPQENGRMEGRTVIQWDKDDVDALRIFKVDLLGLGMLSLLSRAFELLEQTRGVKLDLGSVPQEDKATYDMICAADTIGVFQIESRAQMNMLPRLLPRTFYDLVVEVALVRPGPIQGGMVHPYLRRRRGEEPVDYAHPKLEAVLGRTLGVPIFQEQVMRVAQVVGGYSAGEADQLRRDMAAWRRSGRMQRHRERLLLGMRMSGVREAFAQRIIRQIEGFGEYGFPESHAAAFAQLAYVSAYLKCHYPAEFTTSLLNAQPMGFYSVHTLLSDAHRHDVGICGVDVQHSDYDATMEAGEIRVGLRWVRNLGEEGADAILVARRSGGPFLSIADLARRTGLGRSKLVSLAMAGAFRSLIAGRREAVWEASALGGDDLVANAEVQESQVRFAPLSPGQEMRMNYIYSDSFLDRHPLELYRPRLDSRGVIRAKNLHRRPNESLVEVAGLIIVRQRPTGDGGVIFMALEDETGLSDVVVRPEIWERNRTLLLSAEAILVRGTVQVDGRARSIVAISFTNLADVERADLEGSGIRARNFH